MTNFSNELKGQRYLLERVRYWQKIAADGRRRPDLREGARLRADALLQELGKRSQR